MNTKVQKIKITAGDEEVKPSGLQILGRGGERVVYDENPFLRFTVTAKKRSMTVAKGTEAHTDQGDLMETTIAQIRYVDEDQFVKLFTSQVVALFDLSASGLKVFSLLLCEQQTKIGTDLIFFSKKQADKYAKTKGKKISSSTYTRGITDLINAKIIAGADSGIGFFYINPAVVFNGDRARFITEYRKTPSEKIINENQHRLSFDKDQT